MLNTYNSNNIVINDLLIWIKKICQPNNKEPIEEAIPLQIDAGLQKNKKKLKDSVDLMHQIPLEGKSTIKIKSYPCVKH